LQAQSRARLEAEGGAAIGGGITQQGQARQALFGRRGGVGHGRFPPIRTSKDPTGFDVPQCEFTGAELTYRKIFNVTPSRMKISISEG
jgi:hypothetical protein